jgi:hypothetical protein
VLGGAPWRRDPPTSPRGHFAGTPTRSLCARGAGAPGDASRCPVRCITHFAHRVPPACSGCPPPALRRRDRRRADGDARCAEVPCFHHPSAASTGAWLADSRPRRPSSVAATAGARMGMRAARKAPRGRRGAGRWRAHGLFVRVSQERRRAATSPRCRRAACTRVAQSRLATLPAARVGWHHALRAARRPAPRRPAVRRRAAGARMGMREARRGMRDARGALLPWFARGQRADGAPLRRGPRTSAGGHFTGTPTRSLHARGAGAPDDASGCRGWVA